jgi:tetratricopeptide (TPR) repeat protein
MNLLSLRFYFCVIALAVLLLPRPGFAAKDPDIEAARAAADAQKWDAVIEKTQAVLSRDAKSLDALRLLGVAQIAIGDTLEGVVHLEEALSIKAHDAASLVPLVDCLLARGDVDEADRFVSAAEAKDRRGRLWEIKASRARVLATQGQSTEAIRLLAEATAKNPENSLYPKLLARLYRDQNVLVLAIDHYRHAIELAPSDAQLRFELAQVLLKNKQFDEAMAEFKTVRDADPTNIEVNYQIGKLYFAASRYVEALEPLKAAVKDRPKHFYSQYLLGQTYRNLGDLPEAEKSLCEAYELRPQRREVVVLLTKTMEEQGKYANEIGFLRLALADTSTDAELLTMVGDAYYSLAARDTVSALKSFHYDSAAVFFKGSLAANPAQPRITYRVATVHYNNDQLDSAIVYYRKTLELEPEKCGALINMGYSYGRMKKWTEAIEALRQGTVCDKSNVSARSYLASILAAQGFQNDAIKVYEEVVVLDSANCDAYGQMGLIYFNQEQYVPAIRNLRQAVTFCPDRGDFWSMYGYANWSHFLKIRERIRDSHDGLIPGDELLAEGGDYLSAAERGFGQALRFKPGDKDLKDTYEAVKDYKKRLGGK